MPIVTILRGPRDAEVKRELLKKIHPAPRHRRSVERRSCPV
jgi:hypothetical protein